MGPANKRGIDILNITGDHETEVLECRKIIESCKEFLTSDATFLLLSNLTGLNLHPLASVDSDENGESTKSSSNTDKAQSSCEKDELHSTNLYLNEVTPTTSERENTDAKCS